MDEQIKQEILTILREARDSASPLLETLVEQKVGSRTAAAAALAGIAVVALVVGMWVARRAAEAQQHPGDQRAAKTATQVAAILVAFCLTLVAGQQLLSALYPLGNILP